MKNLQSDYLAKSSFPKNYLTDLKVKKVFGNMTEKEFQKFILICRKDFFQLSDHIKAILLGLVLGDGSIRIDNDFKHARLSFRHSITQREYFE